MCLISRSLLFVAYLVSTLGQSALAQKRTDVLSGRITLSTGQPATAAVVIVTRLVFTLSGSILNELSADRPRQSNRTGAELSFSRADAAARVTVRTFAGPISLRRMQ